MKTKKLTQNDFVRELEDAIRQHKDDPIMGVVDLPPGIVDGVAKLVALDFVLDDERPYFRGVGVVEQPEVFSGIYVKGLHTRIYEPLYETPNRRRVTLSDHIGFVLNEIRKFGVDTKGITSLSLLQDVCKMLVNQNVYFRFSTYGTNVGTFSRWHGAISYTPSSQEMAKSQQPTVVEQESEEWEEDTLPFDINGEQEDEDEDVDEDEQNSGNDFLQVGSFYSLVRKQGKSIKRIEVKLVSVKGDKAIVTDGKQQFEVNVDELL